MRWLLLGLMTMTGCTTTPARVIATPSVCPAARTLPAQTLAELDALPDALPGLPLDAAPEDMAVALLAVRIQSAALYQRARQAGKDLAEWARRP